MAVSDKSVAISSTADFSSESTVSDDWQELTKSDYAKVIFSDLLCNATSGTVECKFQITDNVHEDPNDCVGLFRIGYDDLSQCFVSKMLSQTKCEDDGKLQRCVFTSNELPALEDGFYQFLYVTRDQEVCGASMPFQIKLSTFQLGKNSVGSQASKKMDGDFILVSHEVEGKKNEHEKALVEQNALSEQKKEEIGAWISQNPDYYSLIEQIKEHPYTIYALQQSKDLAMKEVAQLYEILTTKNGELIQLKNMLSAYEEKIKMSQRLQDEKNATIIEMKKSLTAAKEKIKLYELLQNEKDKQLTKVKNEFLLQEKKLKDSFAFQNQLQVQIDEMEMHLKEMKARQSAEDCTQEAAKVGYSMDTVIQKAQDLVHVAGDTIQNIDFTDEHEAEKFFQLKLQLLIILSKMDRATNLANICDRNGLQKTIHSIIEKDVKESSFVNLTSCTLENRDPVLSKDTNAPEVKKPLDFPTSSTAKSPPLPDSNEINASNKDAPKEVAQKISFNKAFESEVLEHQSIELPRLDIINENTINTLLADRPLDTKDVAVINRLTAKIIENGFNLYEAIEVVVDDSSSDSMSDASEMSECSSFIKRDMLCVGKIMEALLCVSNRTSLKQLVVVENEEDKNLIHRNEWSVLLKKCELHYQIEILLDYIEKQKEGMKKVTERICDLLTDYMLLRDKESDSSSMCEKLKGDLDKKDMLIDRLKGELELKNNLLSHFCGQKEKLECRAELAEETLDDLHARILEASDLYKQQYREIARLSRKVQKLQPVKKKAKSFKRELSLTSSESSKTTSSFEVVKEDSAQNINDSDTGEHVFGKMALISNKRIEAHADSNTKFKTIAECCSNPLPSTSNAHEACSVAFKENETQIFSNEELKAVPESCLASCLSPFDDLQPSTHKSGHLTAQTSDDNTNSETSECKSFQTASLFSDFASYEHFQEVVKEIFANMKKPAEVRSKREYFVSCYICKEVFPLHPDLMSHLESEHSMRTCPVCGHLFEDAIPPRYFQIHVEQHFETE